MGEDDRRAAQVVRRADIMKAICLFMPVVFLASGCYKPDANPTKGEIGRPIEDLGEFILTTVTDYGGTSVKTSDLPPLDLKWSSICYPEQLRPGQRDPGAMFHFKPSKDRTRISVPSPTENDMGFERATASTQRFGVGQESYLKRSGRADRPEARHTPDGDNSVDYPEHYPVNYPKIVSFLKQAFGEPEGAARQSPLTGKVPLWAWYVPTDDPRIHVVIEIPAYEEREVQRGPVVSLTIYKSKTVP